MLKATLVALALLAMFMLSGCPQDEAATTDTGTTGTTDTGTTDDTTDTEGGA